ELFGSMVLAVVFAALATAFWAAGVQGQPLSGLASVFFLTVTTSWAVLVPAKFLVRSVEESLSRRLVFLLLGVVVGAAALWVEGWSPDVGLRGRAVSGSAVRGGLL